MERKGKPPVGVHWVRYEMEPVGQQAPVCKCVCRCGWVRFVAGVPGVMGPVHKAVVEHFAVVGRAKHGAGYGKWEPSPEELAVLKAKGLAA